MRCSVSGLEGGLYIGIKNQNTTNFFYFTTRVATIAKLSLACHLASLRFYVRFAPSCRAKSACVHRQGLRNFLGQTCRFIVTFFCVFQTATFAVFCGVIFQFFDWFAMTFNTEHDLVSHLAKNNTDNFTKRRILFRESSTPFGGKNPSCLNTSTTDISSATTVVSAQQQQQLCSDDFVNRLLAWHSVKSIGAGLSNLGNTCFLNSVLQCLAYTAPFNNYFALGYHSKKCKFVGFCLMCEFEALISGLSASAAVRSAVSPWKIASNIRLIGRQFKPGRQEDAHEFLRFFLESMQKNFLFTYKGSVGCHSVRDIDFKTAETSLIYKIFGGKYQSSVTCLSCSHVSRIFETFLDLSLEIENFDSIEKAFKNFTSAERLSATNRYKCESCKNHVEAKKQILLHTLPNILTVHLKRFSATRKIGKFVAFPQIINVSPFCESERSQADLSTLFELYAVLVHKGGSCNSGHYYAFVKASNGCWYAMDDSIVQQVSLQTVLKQEAYILFYRRHSASAPAIERNGILTAENAQKPPRRVEAASPSPGSSPAHRASSVSPRPASESPDLQNEVINFIATSFWRVSSL